MIHNKNEIQAIKIASNRFNVNVIQPNQDKNAKCNIYVSSVQGVNDLFLLSQAELDARNASIVPNKKGVLAKNGDLYKSNLSKIDSLYLADRENRTFLNAIRRLADNPKYSKENCLTMLASDFGKKQNFVNPNTLLNKIDKYFETDTETKTDTVTNETETESSSDTETLIGFDVAYDTIEKLLNKKNVTLDNVQSIHDLCNDIIKQKQNTMKLANVG